jgi:uncharacterized protein
VRYLPNGFMTADIQFALSLMPEADFAQASMPLFADDLIDAVEWSFDVGWGPGGIPQWLDSLLSDYSETGDLLGHGISYSPWPHTV